MVSAKMYELGTKTFDTQALAVAIASVRGRTLCFCMCHSFLSLPEYNVGNFNLR